MASKTAIPEEEYETQFFGFSPSSFVSGVEVLILEHMNEATEQLEQQLQKVPEDILPPREITQGIKLLRQQTDKQIQVESEKLKSLILGNLMKIPSHFLQDCDVDQASQSSASDVSVLQTQLNKLLVQLKNEKLMQAKFRQELKDIQQVTEHQESFLSTVLSSQKMTSVEEAKEIMTFAQANYGEAQELSSKVRRTVEGAEDVSDLQMPSHFIIQDLLQ